MTEISSTVAGANLAPQTPEELLTQQLTGFTDGTLKYYEGQSPLPRHPVFGGWQGQGYESNGVRRMASQDEYRDGARVIDSSTGEGAKRAVELPRSVVDMRGVRLSSVSVLNLPDYRQGQVYEISSEAQGPEGSTSTNYRWPKGQPVSRLDASGELVPLTPDETDALTRSLSEWQNAAERRRGNALVRLFKIARTAGGTVVSRLLRQAS